ncbi:hypothetical protein ACMDCT_11135 [Halomonadaceae bacterium KBTZ08]
MRVILQPRLWARVTVLLALLAMLGGCSMIRHQMYATSGSVMQGLSKEHTTPYVLKQSDVGMSCAMGEATTPLMMSFGRVTDEPNQLGIMMHLSAAGCSETRARERDLAYERLMRDRDPDAAQDARYAARRHYRQAALRFHEAWKNMNSHYGDVGNGECPTERLETETDQFMFLAGLLSGLQAMNTQVRAGEQLGIPNNIGSRVARATRCLDDDRWWGAPRAMRATVWAMVPSAAPEGAKPFKQLEKASRKGEEAGVRLAHVFYAVAAQNAGDEARLREVIRRHAKAIEAKPAAEDWVMIDATATRHIQALSDRLWTRAQGHRTPTGRLGEFWDDPEPEAERIDLNELM